MKKISSLIAIMLLLGAFVSVSFAEDVLSDTTDANTTGQGLGELNIGSGSTPLNIGLSPKVIARYVNPGTTDSTAQWFSIAAGHPGGNVIYATAQDLNNIYSKTYSTGTAITNAILDVSTTKASVEVWTANGWQM